MRYLESFWQRLRQAREARQMSRGDLAELCGIALTVVEGWEQEDARQRLYPPVDALIDLCRYLDVSLEALLDDDLLADPAQLELPGLAFSDADELSGALDELEREVGRVQPSAEEAELLRRFRKSTADNRRMVLQLLGH